MMYYVDGACEDLKPANNKLVNKILNFLRSIIFLIII